MKETFRKDLIDNIVFTQRYRGDIIDDPSNRLNIYSKCSIFLKDKLKKIVVLINSIKQNYSRRSVHYHIIRSGIEQDEYAVKYSLKELDLTAFSHLRLLNHPTKNFFIKIKRSD